MAEGVRIAVTSLHGSPVYSLTRPLTRGVPSHTYGRVQTRDAGYIYGLIIAPVQLKKEA